LKGEIGNIFRTTTTENFWKEVENNREDQFDTKGGSQFSGLKDV